nr:LacI family DNA-binding transcriptional regulator [Microbacterium excoecariae]
MLPSARRTTPNIAAVARDAGVSVGTVSNALNNPERLAPETLGRVRDAIARLGYIRSSAGRTLIRNTSDTLGLIVPDLVNELFVDISRGAQLTAADTGKRLVLANSGFNAHALASGIAQHDGQDEFLEHFAEARVGGIMVCSMRAPGAGIERIRNHVGPIVVVNYDAPGADWCTVLMDNEQVGRASVDHIADLGIRHAFFVSIPDLVQPVVERRRGVHAAAAARGVLVHDVESEGLTAGTGREAMRALLPRVEELVRRGERVAILGLTDRTGIGALQVLRERDDLRVPQDVAVVGMDGDHRPGGIDWVSMTSILLPGYEMGAEGIRLLAAEAEPGHVHERVVLPVRIRPGQSTVG